MMRPMALLAALALASAACAQSTAFVHVNVAPMDSEHVLRDQTVLVKDSRIEAVGAALAAPAGYRVVDGYGYDYIKVYTGLAPEVFGALADAGRAQHMPLVGHGVTSVRLERQLAQGQVMVAHLEEFFYTFFTPAGAQETDVPPDEASIPEAVALAKRHGAAVIADVVTYHAIASQIGHPEVVRAFLAAPETAYLAPSDMQAWRRSGYAGKSARLEAKLAFLRKLAKAMAEGGVELLSGTDAPSIPGLVPGYSLHDNLTELEASHLSRYQALATATSAPGTFIARTKGGVPFGQVVAGYRADLLLTEHNPLDGLATLRAPLGVMAEGRWYDRPALAALQAGVRASYRPD
ncbi:hypothetical protein GTP81_21625 [Rugamonas sp. FT107W]|uniref:Amidohydrolase family protein n=1 Tax=Duganella vulcania TaxID=2692166 RepID=A0A845HPI5_9BURK|nr:hypothetical protein [Duganella vulcania]MYN19349.1 hypothetical protein [Duganella vulcania]